MPIYVDDAFALKWMFTQRKLFLEDCRGGSAPSKQKVRQTSLAFDFVYQKIQASVTGVCPTIKKGDFIRILNKYLSSEEGMDERMDSGRLKRELLATSWASIAQAVEYEFKSEGNYGIELELAEIALQSPLVTTAYKKVYPLLYDCVAQCLLLLPAMEKKKPGLSGKLATLRDDMERMYASLDFKVANKHYRPYFNDVDQHPLSKVPSLLLTDPTAMVTVSHDLLQVIYDFFKGWILQLQDKIVQTWPDLPNETGHPLERTMQTQTGERSVTRTKVNLSWSKLPSLSSVTTIEPIMETRGKDVDPRAKAFAKSKGLPSEAGPSFTTVRFCCINQMVGAVRDLSKQLGVSLIPSLKELDKDTLRYALWGLFGFWSLRYRKSVGPAHCYFEMQEAASQCGFPLWEKPGYPPQKELIVLLRSGYTASVSSRLRQKALKFGLDQSTLRDLSEMDATTTTALTTPTGPIALEDLKNPDKKLELKAKLDMTGVKVHKSLPHPKQ